MEGDFEVNRDTQDKTEKCQSKFFCLSSPKEIICESEYLLNESTLFVAKKKERACEYFLPYGSSGVCCCLVRKELYKRYRI